MAIFAGGNNADRNHSSLISPTRTCGAVTARLVPGERGLRHAEAARAVVPLRKAHMRHADARTPLRFGKFRRTYEILHAQPLLEPFLAESQIIRRGATCSRKPGVQSGAHQRLVVTEV